jgi:hypothetical protein
MRWKYIEKPQPRLADVGRRRLGGPGVLLVATVTADGSPRLSPVEPLFWERDLWLSMGWESRKARDLMPDPRILVHSIVTSRDRREGEFKLPGRAVPEIGHLQKEYAVTAAKELGWTPEVGKFHLFRVDVEDITFIRWDGINDQFVTRWPRGVEFVRRGTSAWDRGSRSLLSVLCRAVDSRGLSPASS